MTDDPTKEEYRRLWFSTSDTDLIVWCNDEDKVVSFEFCYDKYRSEHVLSWRQNGGYIHLAVDDGEQQAALKYKETPIYVADGHLNLNHIHNMFGGLKQQLPNSVFSFVEQKILQFPNHT